MGGSSDWPDAGSENKVVRTSSLHAEDVLLTQRLLDELEANDIEMAQSSRGHISNFKWLA